MAITPMPTVAIVAASAWKAIGLAVTRADPLPDYGRQYRVPSDVQPIYLDSALTTQRNNRGMSGQPPACFYDWLVAVGSRKLK